MPENNKISVAMLVPSLPPGPVGGAEIQALRLAAQLRSLGDDVFFVSEWRPGLPERDIIDGTEVLRPRSFLNTLWGIIPKPRRKTASLPRTDFSSAGTDVKNGASLRRFGWRDIPYVLMTAVNMFMALYRNRGRFRIIHAHHAEWDGFLAAFFAKLLGKKAVIKDSTVNGFSRLRHDLFGGFMASYMADNGNFVAMTAAIKDNMASSGIPENRVSLIPNGVLVPELSARRGDGRYCLFVGNLTQQPAKGFDVLLRAWVKTSAAFPDVRLVVAGAGEEPYVRYASGLGLSGSVSFTGSAGDLSDLYANAAVFVMPSRREGMSNALLEAMSFGLPCVATDVSGVRDLIESGKSGLIVPIDDEGALFAALSRLLADRDLSARLGVAARESVVAKCSFRAVSEKYHNLYRGLIYDKTA